MNILGTNSPHRKKALKAPVQMKSTLTVMMKQKNLFKLSLIPSMKRKLNRYFMKLVKEYITPLEVIRLEEAKKGKREGSHSTLTRS